MPDAPDPHRLSRRSFLSALAAGGAGLGLAPTLLSAVQRAFAIEPLPGSTWEDAEHIVFLMQENRSFDHAFGTLQGVRGFNDPRAITLPSGLPVWCQATAGGEVFTPYRLDVQHSRAAWMGDVPHNWTDQVDARNGGRHDRWLPAKERKDRQPKTLGYFTRADVPFHYALADAFTVCDQHFCSTLTGTTSNRLYFWSGTNRPEQKPEARPNLYNGDSDHSGILPWTCFPERLTRLGIPWKFYQSQLSLDTGLSDEEDDWLGNFGLNVLEYFTAFNVRYADGHYAHLERQVQELPAAIAKAAAAAAARPGERKPAQELAALQARLERARADLVTWHPDGFAKLSEEQRTLHRQAFVTNGSDPTQRRIAKAQATLADGKTVTITAPAGDVLAQFRADVAGGRLPPVSWLAAPKNFSDHPSAPWYGAWYVSEVLNILSADPARWRKTILVLTYDENDGLFDHQPPFVAPRAGDPATGACSAGIDTTLEWTTRDRTSPLGLGYRVPLIVASPWTRGGFVNSQVFDHTSALRLLERFVQRRFGKAVREDNLTSWRRAVAGDLTSVFRPWQGEPLPAPALLDQHGWIAAINRTWQLPPPDPGQPLDDAELAQAKADPARLARLPRQEPGTRPANALPYDLMADGALAADRATLRLEFQALTRLFGAASAGSPFQVTAPGRVAAAPAKTGERQWQDQRIWDFAVAAGERLSAAWPLADFADQRYHLRVAGPNGFLRELRGTAADPALAIAADTEVDAAGAATGNLRLALRAGAIPAGATLRIAWNGYGQPAGAQALAPDTTATVGLPLQRTHGWYDVTLTVDGFPDFARRYAGRVETGRASRTDPVMGREQVGG
jgi:phospholipase C